MDNQVAFHHDFLQEIHAMADSQGEFLEDSFFELFCEHLEEAGELEAADRVHYRTPRGLRIDGYGGDPQEADGILTLIIADFNQSLEVTTLTATEMNAIFKRASNFLTRALDPEFNNSLEETSAVFGLAHLIETRWKQIAKVRLLLISNRIMSERIDGRVTERLHDTPISYNVWDLGRLHRYVMSGRAREDIEIDLVNGFGGELAILPAHEHTDYESYLAVMPGSQLGAIYEHWGTRLLEQNVRVFLQARNKVNRGIRLTLENEPDMFFAYNNGITATATSIETNRTQNGLVLTKLKNFQIVNGGQTTASIHVASRNKSIDLSKVFVQMKLSVVDPEQAEAIVPKISEYANSQNRVNAADFFANHPFHVRMEEFSRRIFAPSPEGSFRETKWFYERARGQYQDARSNLTPAKRKVFDLEYPRRQMFTKTDLAKFINVWEGKPHTVSRGAQKNFADFAQYIGKEWSKNSDTFNEAYYRQQIAKAIVFRRMEKLVMAQPWYGGGYRANIVAYAIAKLAHDVGEKNKSVDFERVWQDQDISPDLTEALVRTARAAHDIITDLPVNMRNRNVTEWAKQQACWSRVQKLMIDQADSFFHTLVSKEELKERRRTGMKNQRELNGIEAQTAVVTAGGSFWNELKQWGEKEKLLNYKEANILALAAQVPQKIPSAKQSLVAMAALNKLQAEGCPLNIDMT